MKPYGFHTPKRARSFWTCTCCQRDADKASRHLEKEWAEAIIDEQLADPMNGENPCADGTCLDCNYDEATLSELLQSK